MSHAVMRRAVAAVSGAALAVLGLGIGGGVASATPGSVTWDDGSERITRTISDVTPAVGDMITSTTAFDRTGGVVEYIQQVKDIHPPCLTYVEGSGEGRRLAARARQPGCRLREGGGQLGALPAHLAEPADLRVLLQGGRRLRPRRTADDDGALRRDARQRHL